MSLSEKNVSSKHNSQKIHRVSARCLIVGCSCSGEGAQREQIWETQLVTVDILWVSRARRSESRGRQQLKSGGGTNYGAGWLLTSVYNDGAIVAWPTGCMFCAVSLMWLPPVLFHRIKYIIKTIAFLRALVWPFRKLSSGDVNLYS